jgi:RNA polymerase sigma-B factor
MVTPNILAALAAPLQYATPAHRARREAATIELLQRRAETTDEAERQRLLEEIVELNLDIARGLAHRYRDRGAEAEDLQQVAFVGLLKAVHYYRLDTDTPFIGYAIPTISGEIKRYFRDCAWTLRIPRRLQEIQGLIASKAPALEQQLSRPPTPTEIAEHLRIDVSEIVEALSARGYFTMTSLEQPIGAGGDLFLADVVADKEDYTLVQLERVDLLQSVLADLGPRERRILHLSFIDGRTQAEIGEEIGVSQMQVSRILRRILNALRDKLTEGAAAA